MNGMHSQVSLYIHTQYIHTHCDPDFDYPSCDPDFDFDFDYPSLE